MPRVQDKTKIIARAGQPVNLAQRSTHSRLLMSNRGVLWLRKKATRPGNFALAASAVILLRTGAVFG